MKMFAAVFVGIWALSNALPTTEVDSNAQNRLISDQIVSAIEDLSQKIKDAGLDPYILERFSVDYALPVPVLFDVSAYISDLLVTGASNIVVHRMSYALLTSRLTMDISLPRIQVNLGDASLDLTVLGKNAKASTNFEFAIVNARLAGRINVNVGIISGVYLKDSNLEFTLGGIEFDGDVNILGYDLSQRVEKFLTKSLPNQIRLYRKEINELINIVVLDVGNKVLN